MVPFNKKIKQNGKEITIKVAQFQLGYKGYIQLAERTGVYRTINVLAIKEGELKKYDPLNETIEVDLIEDDDVREQTETVGYYAMFEYLNGFRKTMYWTKKKMLSHADKYSKAFNREIYQKILDGKIPETDMWKYSSFWYKDFDGMAYKTMLRQLISKWGIMSIEMQEAYAKDMAEIKENGDYDYIDSTDDEDIGAIEITDSNENENTAETNKKVEEKQEVKEEKQKVEKEDIRPQTQTQSNFEYGDTEDEFFK